MEGADKERNRLLLVKHAHMHNTRPFSETHHLMLAMEGANKERNRLHLVKCAHIHKTRPFSKTHILMLAREREDKKTGYFKSNIHIIKLY